MGKIFLFFYFFIGTPLNSPNQDFEKIFGDDYQDALNFVKEHEQLAISTFQNDNQLAKRALAIVFPELIRYSMVRDFFETSALELFYVEKGKGVADFSIGPFQMKPSFVESLEQIAIKNYPEIANQITTDNNLNEVQKRKTRVERLKLIKWQLQYLKAFIHIYTQKENIQHFPLQEQVVFLAYAYNHGINTHITNHNSTLLISSSKYFPYGSKYPGEQYSYAEIAQYFFLNQSF